MSEFSSELANYATAIGIALGVAGGAWKWFLSEWIRVSREVPSLEGDVETREASAAPGSRVLQIDVVWRNTSSMPLHVDCERVRAFIAAVGKVSGAGPVTQAAIEENADLRITPLEGCRSYILEPNTTSRIQMLLNLTSVEPQFFAIHFPLDRTHHRLGHQAVAFDRVALLPGRSAT